MRDGYVDMWDNWSKKRRGFPAYDLWLEDYVDILDSNRNEMILDLGCGIGANTRYLLEKGYSVLSCDFSLEALKNIEMYFPTSKVKYLNMLETFPFADEAFSLAIADLSLHYFNHKDTVDILREIKRILKKDGILLARVASVRDYHFGAGKGKALEKNFYFEGDYEKRFFDEEDVKKYFEIIGDVTYEEKTMLRDEEEYQKPKILYQIRVKRS